MLLLSFHIGNKQYAVAATQIIEILPLTRIQPLPKTPEFVVGLLDFRGKPVPVIDLCQLTEERPYNKVLSSRIVLVNYSAIDSKQHPLGLIAEKVTETFTIPKEQFTESGIKLEAAPYLGRVTKHGNEMLQYIEINELLPEEVQTILFQDSSTPQQVSNE